MSGNGLSRLFGCCFLLIVTALVVISGAHKTMGVHNDTQVLGLVVTATEDSWKDDLTTSIKFAAQTRGMEVMPIEAERSQASQIEAIRALIVYRADAIVFSPVIETGWDNVLIEAKNAGIPVVAVDKAVRVGRDGINVSYVGYDYYAKAKKAAQFFLDSIPNNEGALVELYGTVGSYPAKEITRGFRETIAKDGRYQISYSVCGDYMRSRGREIIEGLLKNKKKINTIISHNDAMTLGAIDALEQVDQRPGTDVKIFAFGGGRETVALFREGKINCLVQCDLTTIGDRTLEAVSRLMNGDALKSITLLANTRLLVKGVSTP